MHISHCNRTCAVVRVLCPGTCRWSASCCAWGTKRANRPCARSRFGPIWPSSAVSCTGPTAGPAPTPPSTTRPATRTSSCPRRLASCPSHRCPRRVLLSLLFDALTRRPARACRLQGGEAKFNVNLYNYQSRQGDPAVLAIVATAQGTSAQIVNAEGEPEPSLLVSSPLWLHSSHPPHGATHRATPVLQQKRRARKLHWPTTV